MNTIYALKNEFGVKVNIRTHSSTDLVPMTPIFANFSENQDLLSNHLRTDSIFHTNYKMTFSALLLHKTKSFFLYIFSLPAVVGKKILKFFEENPYSYPTYPFHFPILIYSDTDLFSHPDYWDAFDEERIKAEEQKEKKADELAEIQVEQQTLLDQITKDKFVA